MRILIYRPELSRQTIRMTAFFNCEPLEMEYLYTVLKDKAEIRLLDGQIKKYDLRLEIKEWQPQLLLITSIITNVNQVLNIAHQVKQLESPPLIFVGGPHAEVLPQHYFSNDIDAVFFNNQLEAIKKVVQALVEKQPYYQTKGVAFRVGDTFVKNEPEAVDYVHFPIPERPLLKQHRGKYFLMHYPDCASIKTSFGCPEKCSFCFCRKMNQEAYSRRSLTSIMDEIESIPSKNIYIVDDNFLLSPTRLQKFCEEIHKRKIQKNFIVYATSRFIAGHPQLMRELREAGLKAVMVGFEFIDDKALAEYQKGSVLADNEATIKICHELDIDLMALFMIDPDWPRADFKKLARYIRSRKIYMATFGTITTLPGTDLWTQQGKKEVGIETQWWRYDLLRLHQKPKYMTALNYYLWMAYLYLLPTLRIDGWAYYIRRAGWRHYLKMVHKSFFAFTDFMYKLAVWP